MTEPQRYSLTLEEAAEVLTVGVPTVEELIAQGMLRAQEEDGQRCVLYEDLLAYLRHSRRAQGEAGDLRASGSLPL
jgi:excisionase family DNA binding protein